MSNRIYQSLPVKDGLIFALIPANRSLLDVSGYGHNGSASAGMSWIREGGIDRLRGGGTSVFTVADVATLRAVASCSIFVAGTFPNQAAINERLVSKRDAGGNNYELLLSSVANQVSGLGQTATVPYSGKSSLAVTGTNGSPVKFYTDGSNLVVDNNALITPVNAPLKIGNYYTTTLPFSGNLKAVLIYDIELSQFQVAANHAWSESLSSPNLSHDRRYFDMGSQIPHGNANGEVGSWDARDVTERILPDRSGDGNIGTMVGQVSTAVTEMGPALDFHADEGRVTLLDDIVTDSPISVSFLFKPRSAGTSGGGRIVDNGKLLVYFRLANRISLSSTGGVEKIDSAAGSIPYGLWSHVVVTRDASGAGVIYVNGEESVTGATGTPVASAAVTIGNRATTDRGCDGQIANISIKNRVMSLAEVRAEYQPIRRKLNYQLDLSIVPPTLVDVTAGQVIPGTDYTVENGSFAVQEITRKAIVSTVAGIKWRINPDAYGTWEWGWQKLGAASAFSMAVVASVRGVSGAVGQDGYIVVVDANERIFLIKNVAGTPTNLFFTATGYVAIATDYRFRLTRSKSGVFTLYIKGGDFTAWTLVDPTGGGGTPGTNPVISTDIVISTYEVSDQDAGDTHFVDEQYQGTIEP